MNGRGNIPFIQSELCNERGFGIMEGLTWDDVQNIDPPILFIKVGNDLHSVNPMGSEPFEDVWARAQKFRAFIFEDHAGSDILIVSHGVFLQLFHGLLKRLSCIESLAFPYPAKLELNSFRFSGFSLVDEKKINLTDEKKVAW
jgi:broad specificity phosphatase PhoE